MKQNLTVAKAELGKLFSLLKEKGYVTVGPTVREGAIVYAEINSPEELPRGLRDVQEAGKYRLKQRGDDAYFGYVVGPHSWKQFLFPPHLTLFSAKRDGNDDFSVAEGPPEPPTYAFIGVRACEVAAIAVQDRVFNSELVPDSYYAKARAKCFIVAVNCTEPGNTCFCASMGTGPRHSKGFDIALTESDDGFHVEVGSQRGQVIVDALQTVPATKSDDEVVDLKMALAAENMGRDMDTTNIRDLMVENLEHPHWNEVAERCLACANCTMVCPTCFCSTVTDHTDLTAQTAERHRQWDSCFNLDFSYTVGHHVRNSIKSRYRQWLTHKLAYWHDQFDSSGCVGCGRCITWCPVGIDLTEEVAALRQKTEADSRQSRRAVEKSQ